MTFTTQDHALAACAALALAWALWRVTRRTPDPMTLPPRDSGVIPPSAYLGGVERLWQREGKTWNVQRRTMR